MRKLFFVLFLLFLISSIPSNAWAITVQLDISCEDAALYNETVSAINTEFRHLSDVYVTNGIDADFIINIIVLETKNVSGYAIGITYSTVVLKPFDNKTFISLLPKGCYQYNKSAPIKIPKDATKEEKELFAKTQKTIDNFEDHNKNITPLLRKEFWLQMTNNLFKFDNHFINVGAKSDVQDICRRIVAKLNVNSFEKLRATH